MTEKNDIWKAYYENIFSCEDNEVGENLNFKYVRFLLLCWEINSIKNKA
jgi:hypothetical protein